MKNSKDQVSLSAQWGETARVSIHKLSVDCAYIKFTGKLVDFCHQEISSPYNFDFGRW